MPQAVSKYEQRMWATAPRIKRLLKGASDLEEARRVVYDHLEERKRGIRSEGMAVPSWEWEVVDDCVDVLKNVFSSHFEKVARYSALKALWQLARGRYSKRQKALSPGFFEEFRHLFLGISGKSVLYRGMTLPAYTKEQGRKAALWRSKALDDLAVGLEKGMSRFPSGFDEPLLSQRRRNAARIKTILGAADDDWTDWHWQFRNVIRDRETLEKIIPLTREEEMAVDLAESKGVPFGVTPYYASLLLRKRLKTRVHATRAQVIPPLDYIQQMVRFRGRRDFACDFMLEQDTSPIDLVTRRYPRIAILKPYSACFQVCVYCQRNWEITGVGDVGAAAPKRKLDAALRWIRNTPAINEVLVTGGDPLAMIDDSLEYVLKKLAEMKSVERIRIGTRSIVVAPMRMTQDLADMIARYNEPPKREVIVVTHFEHSSEVTPESMLAVRRLRRRGIAVYNQAVLTFANCRRFEMCKLRVDLRRIGVDPYYLFNAKAKDEMSKYRVPLARLGQERKEEARLQSGMVRIDAPVYNIPRLGKHNVIAWQHHRVIMILPDGRRIYEFQPWEKYISPEEVFVETDVSIFDFLQDLKRRGENTRDYRTIWYYF
ncbi:KamA family radical SAM protein [Thermodesulfobacteriota bacterium]